MSVTVVVGNPKPGSRTLAAAERLARGISGRDPDATIDVVGLGPSLLGWGDDTVKAAVATVQDSDVVVFASPTYKGSITGVLKCFLDQFPTGGLAGVTGVALMLGAGSGHALAPEYALRPVLAELGAAVPARGLYLLESAYEDDTAYEPWLTAWRPALRTAAEAIR